MYQLPVNPFPAIASKEEGEIHEDFVDEKAIRLLLTTPTSAEEWRRLEEFQTKWENVLLSTAREIKVLSLSGSNATSRSSAEIPLWRAGLIEHSINRRRRSRATKRLFIASVVTLGFSLLLLSFIGWHLFF